MLLPNGVLKVFVLLGVSLIPFLIPLTASSAQRLLIGGPVKRLIGTVGRVRFLPPLNSLSKICLLRHMKGNFPSLICVPGTSLISEERGSILRRFKMGQGTLLLAATMGSNFLFHLPRLPNVLSTRKGSSLHRRMESSLARMGSSLHRRMESSLYQRKVICLL
jgi:hypothetical protein